MNYQDFKGLTFKVHPELDKQAWTKQRIIRAKNSGEEGEERFSTQTKLDALRYRYTSKEEDDLPFTINVFNSRKQGKNLITIEVEYNQNQSNLKFSKLGEVKIYLSMGDGSQEVDLEVTKQEGDVDVDRDNN